MRKKIAPNVEFPDEVGKGKLFVLACRNPFLSHEHLGQDVLPAIIPEVQSVLRVDVKKNASQGPFGVLHLDIVNRKLEIVFTTRFAQTVWQSLCYTPN